jgi:DNA modification methylase
MSRKNGMASKRPQPSGARKKRWWHAQQGWQQDGVEPRRHRHQDFRIPDAVLRIMRHKGKIGQDIDHPAVFPVALPQFVLESYTDKGEIVFEPFGGSGTTMLAAQRAHLPQRGDCGGVRGRGHQAFPAKPPRRAGHAAGHGSTL